ncbi:hypothetical protein QJS04_geneDACA016187 [Acorus gramineus]|uniref:BPL/LPL catalytic domain-containing protein n=1 Tax=Acorus gramineus TaxID=55184 RepID=A0AAV9B1F9_ACOGR|nr:hypothetical protein QJS04_geneDACA016187 [Acorus gramineus]
MQVLILCRRLIRISPGPSHYPKRRFGFPHINRYRFLTLVLKRQESLPSHSIYLSLHLSNLSSVTRRNRKTHTNYMENMPSLLVLCGKTDAEEDCARSLKENKNLKLADGEEFVVLLHTEQAQKDPHAFNFKSYLDSLSTRRFGRFLIWSPRLPSTHDFVSQNFSELPLGAICVAEIQSKGRGRAKNVWDSPSGCLLFSYTLQMENGHILPLLQYVVSLAIIEAIKMVCGSKGFPYLDVRIKWPNDLYLNGLKVGGVGLNLDNEKPTTCLNAVLRELTCSTNQLMREDILGAFFQKFEDLFEIFLNQGFIAKRIRVREERLRIIYHISLSLSRQNTPSSHQPPSSPPLVSAISSRSTSLTLNALLLTSSFSPFTLYQLLLSSNSPIQKPSLQLILAHKVQYNNSSGVNSGFQALEDLYYKAWLHSGQKVVIEEKDEESSAKNVVVTIQGLTSSGYLLAIGEDNKNYELHPDGNSFDFFKGLVRKKIG